MTCAVSHELAKHIKISNKPPGKSGKWRDHDSKNKTVQCYLRLPHHEAHRIFHGISKLESQYAVLGQVGVVHREGGLMFPDVLQGTVFRLVFLVVYHAMPVAEGPALHVLFRV